MTKWGALIEKCLDGGKEMTSGDIYHALRNLIPPDKALRRIVGQKRLFDDWEDRIEFGRRILVETAIWGAYRSGRVTRRKIMKGSRKVWTYKLVRK